MIQGYIKKLEVEKDNEKQKETIQELLARLEDDKNYLSYVNGFKFEKTKAGIIRKL